MPDARERFRQARRFVLRVFARVERPAAWLLLAGGTATFVAVLFDLIATGGAKWATLLIAADLIVSGFSAVQEAEGDEDDRDLTQAAHRLRESIENGTAEYWDADDIRRHREEERRSGR